MQQIIHFITEFSTIWYIALVVLIGFALSYWVYRWISRVEALRSSELEGRKNFEAVKTKSPLRDSGKRAKIQALESIKTRFAFFRRILIPAILFFWILILTLPVLQQVPAAYVSFFLGILTVVVGIAAKPFIENLISGLVISVSQPVRIGDTVLVDEHYGTIEEISLTHTIIKVWDWRRYVLSNSQLLSKEFINFSLTDRFQWAYVEFFIAPGEDLLKVAELAREAMKSSNGFVPYEAPAFWVIQLGKEATECWIAGWADTPSNAWILMHETRIKLTQAFHENGIRTHSHEVGSLPHTAVNRNQVNAPIA